MMPALVRGTSAILAIVPVIGQIGRFAPRADLFNSFLPVVLSCLVLTLIAALLVRDRRAVLIALAGLAIGGAQLGHDLLATTRDGPRGAGSFTILTLSAYHANPAPHDLRAVLDASAADIVLLQESNGAAAADISASLSGYHRLRSCPQSACSLTILSRWPLHRIALPRPGETGLPDLLAAQIDRPGAAFRVIDLHLPRMTLPHAERHKGELVSMIRSMGAQTPLLAGGDFNLATGTFALRRLVNDSGLNRVDRLIPSYPANLPVPAFLPIDHILASGHWRRKGCRPVRGTGSDHLGIICTFAEG